MKSEPKRQPTKFAAGPNVALHKALSHPLRWRITQRLGESEATPTMLAEELGEERKRICEQVTYLRNAGLVELVDNDRRRGGTQHWYKATIRVAFDQTEWDLMPQSAKETTSVSIVRVIVDDAAAAINAGVFDGHERRVLIQKPMVLDDQGMVEFDEYFGEGALDRMQEIEAASYNRRAKSGESGIPVKASVMIHPAAPAQRP